MLKKKLIILSMFFAIAFISPMDLVHAAAKEDVSALKEQIAQLQKRVLDLEGQLGKKQCPRSQSLVMDDPMDPFDAMDRYMQAMMTDPFTASVFMGPRHHIGKMRSMPFSPDYDIKATDKAYVISFDMPGMDKAKINVEVKDGMLLVSGERSSETKEDQGGQMYRQQRSFGYFSRTIPLPEDAKPESVQAKYENGVLTLTVEKKDGVKPALEKQKIEVK